MSDVPELDATGLPEELSAFDQILHRGEANPRTRSGIMTMEILDTTPDWDRFRTRFENVSRKVLRLRQKVVMPTLPTAAPSTNVSTSGSTTGRPAVSAARMLAAPSGSAPTMRTPGQRSRSLPSLAAHLPRLTRNCANVL